MVSGLFKSVLLSMTTAQWSNLFYFCHAFGPLDDGTAATFCDWYLFYPPFVLFCNNASWGYARYRFLDMLFFVVIRLSNHHCSRIERQRIDSWCDRDTNTSIFTNKKNLLLLLKQLANTSSARSAKNILFLNSSSKLIYYFPHVQVGLAYVLENTTPLFRYP